MFDNPHALDWSGFIGRMHSASYYPPKGPLRDELDRAMHELFDANEDDGQVIIGQQTEVTLASR